MISLGNPNTLRESTYKQRPRKKILYRSIYDKTLSMHHQDIIMNALKNTTRPILMPTSVLDGIQWWDHDTSAWHVCHITYRGVAVDSASVQLSRKRRSRPMSVKSSLNLICLHDFTKPDAFMNS